MNEMGVVTEAKNERLKLEIPKTFIRDISTIDRALINLLAKRCELLGKTRADRSASD